MTKLEDYLNKLDPTLKFFLLTILVLGSLYLISSAITSISNKNLCSNSGGKLMNNNNGLRCINLSSIDLCYDNNVIEVKQSYEPNFSINWSIK